jgi:hypothetical protein
MKIKTYERKSTKPMDKDNLKDALKKNFKSHFIIDLLIKLALENPEKIGAYTRMSILISSIIGCIIIREREAKNND